MDKKSALYAGSFDPFTNGHYDIVKRGLTLFDEITIVIAVSPSKKSLISKDDRKRLLETIYENNPMVKIDTWDGLIVDYAKTNNMGSIIRGLRPTGDFEMEFQMASMNRKLYPDAETVFLMTGENLYYVSSSLVKEVHNHGGDISEFVPTVVLEYLKNGKNK
jgi:pantetheine-phosphate adenylyltransferase